MGMPGAKPKPDGQKRNRVKPVQEWVEIVNVPHQGGPKLPSKQPDGRVWPTATKQWWSVVASMPHCILWTKADWRFALDTAFIASSFHGGEMRQAAELRQREKILGLTLDARRDLRIRYVAKAAVSEESAGVVNIADYREALG